MEFVVHGTSPSLNVTLFRLSPFSFDFATIAV
jgi:hypothetical protein